MKIKKGDSVQMMTGNDAGKTGRVIKVFPDKEKIVVEGISVVKKHARPTQDNPQTRDRALQRRDYSMKS